MKKVTLEADVYGYESGSVGGVDVWLPEDRDRTYLGAWYGFSDDVASKLEGGGWMGLARYIRKNHDEDDIVAYLAGMEVRQDLTHRGLGSEMVRAFIQIARDRGCRSIYLHRSGGSRSSDDQLETFYKRLGFTNVRCCVRDVYKVMELGL